MTFPFVRGYPQDNSSLGQSKTTIRNNLDGTLSTIGIDHINNNGDPGAQPAGYHNVTHWVPKAGNPAAIPGYGQMYSKTVNADQQIFWESGNGIVQQLTTNVTPVAAGNGISFLPGGIIIQWGRINAPIPLGGPVAGNRVTFAPAFPNNVFSITLGPARTSQTDNGVSINSPTIDLTGFNVTSGSNNYVLIYWMAIGN